MIETTIGNTCWKELANAIVIQAVVDYRKLRRKQRSGVVLKPEEQSDYEKIRRFFCGEGFVMLTDIDGPALLKKLDGESSYIRTHIYI